MTSKRHAVRNGMEALRALDEFDPDVITLDINMPEMDGLTCLSRIMVQRPKPVVMVSSLTEQGAEATFEALQLGAVDFVHKPDGTMSRNILRIERELLLKVRSAATTTAPAVAWADQSAGGTAHAAAPHG